MSGADSLSQLSALNSQLAARRAAYEQHFIRRAKEHFGLRVSPERYLEWCRRVSEVDEGVHCLGRDTPTRTQWGVRFGGYVMRVVFDDDTERLVTCMSFAEQVTFGSPRDRRMKRRRLACARRGKGKVRVKVSDL